LRGKTKQRRKEKNNILGIKHSLIKTGIIFHHSQKSQTLNYTAKD